MAEGDDFGLPDAKRQKVNGQHSTHHPAGSRLFAPFRTIGLVSPTTVPFTSIPLGKPTFQITTSIGRSLQTYDLRRGLSLVFLSRPQCPERITATVAYRDRVFVAWGGSRPNGVRGIWVFRRGKLVDVLESRDTAKQEISQILVFGSWIIACGPEAVEVWKNDTYEHYTTILPSSTLDIANARAFSGQICTLPTFLNKVFVGRQDGNVEIYNVSTAKLVHTILAPSPTSGAVTCLTPASALGLLAIAHAEGFIVIHDVDADKQLLGLQNKSGQSVTSMTFRTDGMGAGDDGRKEGVMATASIESGDITLWDLNRGGKVVGVLRSAHATSNQTRSSGISKVEFLPGQPVIVSTGVDNALRSWIFDQNPFSSLPRILHSRSGHAAPVSKLKFLPAGSDGSDAAGKWLLSAAQDRSFWGFSLRRDAQSTELSQGNVKHKAKKVGHLSDDASSVEDFKAPPIIDIACSLNRDGGMGAVRGPVWTNTKSGNAEESAISGWESVVTAHDGDCFARTWFWGRKKAGRWAFESGDRTEVTSVAITSCGTFALVGSAGGCIDMFNLQSGIHRQRFPPRLTQAQAKNIRVQRLQSGHQLDVARGHRDGITGLVVDNLNRTLISSSLDGSLRFWDFAAGNLIHQLDLDGAAATALRYNPVSGLVALSCDDLCIRVVDIETQKLVRELWGCVGQIYDLCFSHDGQWIVACSMDSVVRVFDLATGQLIDAFRTTTCTNVAFSSTGEFLATTHAGALGVNIWNNKALFQSIVTRQIDEEYGILTLTETEDIMTISPHLGTQDLNSANEEIGDDTPTTSEVDQLDTSLLTLSFVPQSRWQTLLNLETIRQRNKPIQPPEKPKAAPFFLGSNLTNGLKEMSDVAMETTTLNAQDSERSRIARRKNDRIEPQSRISTVLSGLTNGQEGDSGELVRHFSSLTPSATDLEIRSLTLREMPLFVRALTSQLQLRRDYELVNTWMSIFLKIHGDFVTEMEDLKSAVNDWRRAMELEEDRLSGLVGYTKGVLEFLRSAR